MTKHTPGPWRYEPGTNTVRSEPANYWLGTLDSWDGAVKDQTEANGRLMAAAPELLAALIKVRDSFIYADDHSDTAVMPEADNHCFDAVCAAIVAATCAASGAERGTAYPSGDEAT